MYINHDKKFIFVHVPKTAGSSIHISNCYWGNHKNYDWYGGDGIK